MKRFAVGTVVLGLAFGGCAPLHASRAITEGTTALDEAAQNDGPKYAKYEFTKAEALLNEARAKEGYSEYDVAAMWATDARDLAKEASRIATRRRDLERRRNKGKTPGETSPIKAPTDKKLDDKAPTTVPAPGMKAPGEKI